MAHNLCGQRLFASDREPIWHRLGEVFKLGERYTVTEAFTRARMMYKFHRVTQPIHLPAITMYDGTFFDATLIPDPTERIMREPIPDDPQWRQINVVAPRYGLIQNDELARRLDPLSKRWPVETAGALGFGETVFVTLATDTFEIAGDQINRYLLISDGKGGDYGLRIACVDTRVVCQNTLEAAWSQKNSWLKVSIPHHSGVSDDLDLYVGLFEQIEKAQHLQRQAFEILAETRNISTADAESVINAAVPLPERKVQHQRLSEALGTGFVEATPELIAAQERLEAEDHLHDVRTDRVKLLRSQGMECYIKLCDEFPKIARTAWAAYNAAAELSDCRLGQSEESAAAGTCFGDRQRERGNAFRAAWKLTGVPVLR